MKLPANQLLLIKTPLAAAADRTQDDSAFYWHLLALELAERGSEVVAVDLPCEDESARLMEYVEAIGD